MTKSIEPQVISDIDVAFPANVTHLMPRVTDIPVEFFIGSFVWSRIASRWFYEGLKLRLMAKDGIDRGMAIRHLRSILGSFEPKHEHKIAAVGYLMSLWFELPTEVGK